MKKILLILVTLSLVLGLTLSFATPALAASMPGVVWTTNSAGKTVNQNLYAAKTDVCLNGGSSNNKSPGLPAGNYFVQVTTLGGTVLGKTPTASVIVGADGKIGLVQLWSILYRTSSGYTIKGYDNTTSNGGEYKVWVSKDPTFSNNQSKTDNFKVKPILGTVIVKKNTTGGNGVFNFTGTGGNGLPGSFSISTSGNSGMAVYDVSPGTYSISEVVGSDWTLTSASASPTFAYSADISSGSSPPSTTTTTSPTTTATRTTTTTTTKTTTTSTTTTTTTTPVINPVNFTVVSGGTMTVTFNNKEKLASTTTTILSSGSINMLGSVKDTATVTGTSTTPTGTVRFEVSTDGGTTFTPFGGVKTLVNGSAASDPYFPAAGGDNYRFRAVYSGDAKYKGSQSGVHEEPLTVNKLASSTSTTLSDESVAALDSVTDTATVTGAGPTPTGTITFEVSTDGGGTFTPFGGVKTLVNGSAYSDPYTPDVEGDNYRFRAVYSGDANYEVSQSGDQDEILTVGSGSSQRWYLDSIDNPVMEKTLGVQQGSVPVEGTTVTWLSNAAANTDVVFEPGTWKVYLATDDLYGNYTVSIGESDGSGGFTPFASKSGTANGQPISVKINTGGTVPVDHYLALQITNNGAGSIITDGSSYLCAPTSDPSYPLPEMASVLLLGIGLAGIAGFVVIKRRRIKTQ
jgi:hypothetical protein